MSVRVQLMCFVGFLLIGIGIYKITHHHTIYNIPKVEETWWGIGPPSDEDNSIEAFNIIFPDEVIEDLRFRLKNVRPLPKPLENVGQSYGVSSQLTMRIVDYWLNKYNWREREKYLNQYSHYKTKIQGLNIHFMHVKPKQENKLKVIPLLLLHGWPSSIVEFYDIITHLKTPQKGYDFVYEVIAPSLPGYGFSDGAPRPGLGVTQMAMIFKNLMQRLNFERFLVAGGDWGSILASHMSILFTENIIGMHSSMCLNISPSYFLKKFLYTLRPSLIVEKKYEHLAYPIPVILPKILEEIGYVHLQATKPDTLGVALTDSPSGLAVYIIEKFLSLSDPNWKNTDVTNLTAKFNTDVLIDNVMIYWATGTITSSMRLFSEAIHKTESSLLDRFPVRVPTACARFIKDLFYNPVALLEDKYVNLLQVTDNEGGHFPALESPHVLALDIYAFTEKVLTLYDKNNIE